MLGKQIYAALQQPPEERHTLTAQQLILETIILGEGQMEIDVAGLKNSARELSSKVHDDKDFDRAEQDLLKKHGKRVQEPAKVEEKTDASS
jgi:hypothetical protein